MIETVLYYLKPMAPVMIMVAAFLDTFIGTGYILYGFALLASVGMMHMQGLITVPEIIVAASLGTIAASSLNFGLGHWFGHTSWVQRRTTGPVISELNRYLDTYGLWWFIVIGRSITILRPSYGLVLGLLGRPWGRFIVYEVVIATVWVSFWLAIILFGETLITQLFAH